MLTTLKTRSLYTKVVRRLPFLVTSRIKGILPHPLHANLVFRRPSSTSSQAVPVYSRALEFGDKTAVIDCHGSHSYSQLYRSSQELSVRLSSLISPGDRVAMLTPNTAEYVISQWAVWMAGGVAVPLCRAHPPSSHQYYLQDSEAQLLLVTHDLHDSVSGLGVATHLVEASPSSAQYTCTEHKTGSSSASPAMILYTSGTTGPPKGVVLSHANLASQVSCLLEAWEWRASDSLLHVLPLHHTHGIVNCLLCPLTVGATVRMLPSFSASSVWDILIRGDVNLFMAVPTIYSKLLEHLSTQGRELDTRQCQEAQRLMVSGSAALAVPTLTRWAEVTGHTLLERYGMTEIGMALSQPLHGTRVPGFVGAPLPGVQARLVSWSDEGGYDILAEADHSSSNVTSSEAGELLIKGPNVFKEYHNKPEATGKEFTEDGWFKTGDTAKIENGNFRILGRTSADIIKSGGYKISALDVETVLLTHPAIMDLAIIGVEDETWGQVVAAVIVPRPGTESGDLEVTTLRSWCRDKMPRYWTPSMVRLLPEMPRNVMGKVNKKELVKTLFPPSSD